MTSGFFYRLRQKWKYRMASNAFERSVAEINRYNPHIVVSGETFRVRNCDLDFNRKHHSFIAERFELFELLKSKGRFETTAEELFYSYNGVTVRVTTSEELFILYEIFLQRCYTVRVPWNFNVIDIGMNVGFASLYFAAYPNVSAVFGYEPFRSTYQDAKINFQLNPVLATKISPHNFGLGSQDELLRAQFLSDKKGKSSIKNTGSETETIEIKNGVQVMASVVGRSAEKFFVKMDCEGAEFDIFEGLSHQGIPERIFGFIIEWHKNDPSPIIDTLMLNNFKVQLRGDSDIGLITAFR